MKKTWLPLFIMLIMPVWALAQSITVTNPAANQKNCMHKQQWIYWDKTGAMADKVSIFLTHPSGQSIKRTIAVNVPNSGRYQWDGGVSTPGNYRIKISVSTTAQHPAQVSGQSGIFTLDDCQKPDLQVGVIKVSPQNPGEGQTVTFKGNVMNYGVAPAQNPVVTLTVDRPAGLTRKTFRKQFNLSLQKNQGVTFVQKFKVPKQGNYTATFRLDPARMIAETNDNNNSKTWTFGVHALPDLIVCISNGKRPPVGRNREIRAVVKNIGSGNTDGVASLKLRFYVEKKGRKTYNIPPLASGKSHTIKRNHKWGGSGTKTISAKVLYVKNETNKRNNEVKGSYFVRLPHHDKYSAAPKIKCSTNKNYNSWEQFENQY